MHVVDELRTTTRGATKIDHMQKDGLLSISNRAQAIRDGLNNCVLLISRFCEREKDKGNGYASLTDEMRCFDCDCCRVRRPRGFVLTMVTDNGSLDMGQPLLRIRARMGSTLSVRMPLTDDDIQNVSIFGEGIAEGRLRNFAYQRRK